ncbi:MULTISPECIES: hypothetical protein [unclassified Lentimonas]|uniref:hypothetical protein n=1 Tax=unclassified Lentimonas TaxID=2630993 RepID=UPI0013231370|nr:MULTISPECIES: hypothetical protein [unclassified Lentimonas]CAA6695202.1 Unannotated [Lentimonas sp. CC19]CAA6697290.1 Unannotated [Lentimonas sp. CC10]CAA7070426.1 Unannotated [Lentimonas sp. CC11]
MSPVLRGFAGLFAVVFLAVYVTQMEDRAEAEAALIREVDAIEAASLAYERGDLTFYEVWFSRTDKDGREVGGWILLGQKEIPEELLGAYPDRFQFRNSKHFGLTHEQNLFSRRARKWSLAYNTHLAKLLSPELANP